MIGNNAKITYNLFLKKKKKKIAYKFAKNGIPK